MKRLFRRILPVLVLGAALYCGLPAAPSFAASNVTVFRVRTVPAVEGLRFSFQGQTAITGRGGSTSFSVPLSAQAILTSPFALGRAVRLLDNRRPDGSIFRLQRWYSERLNGVRTLTAALREFVPTTVTFINPSAGAFRAKNVDAMVVKRSDGAVFRFPGKTLEHPVLLQATRVVPLGGGLVSKDLLYRVQAVTIEGNNLVNRSQQAFLPAHTAKVELKLLFYSARFVARDRLFQFTIGSGIQLQFPNGRVHFYRFDKSGAVTLPALPRGNYRITVKAPGLKVTSPVAMTRDQVATLKVVSYLDVAVLATVMLSIAIGLLLVGRPVLRGRLRRVFTRTLRRPAHTAAST